MDDGGGGVPWAESIGCPLVACWPLTVSAFPAARQFVGKAKSVTWNMCDCDAVRSVPAVSSARTSTNFSLLPAQCVVLIWLSVMVCCTLGSYLVIDMVCCMRSLLPCNENAF